MCHVWRARDLEANRIVTIKHLAPEDLGSRDRAARLLEEGKILQRLQNERILRLLACGVDQRRGLFLVIEYFEGVSLSSLLASKPSVMLHERAFILREVALALAHAHRRGIVHRDLKAGNVLVGNGNPVPASVRLIDFGIAKDRNPGGLDVTSPGQSLGSPGCMAPEQLRGDHVDSQSVDIWAFGVLAYRMLALREPFPAKNAPSLAVRILSAPALPLPPLFGGTRALGKLAKEILQCLRFDSAKRPNNLDEMIEALAPFAQRARPQAISEGIRNCATDVRGDCTTATAPSRPLQSTPALGTLFARA